MCGINDQQTQKKLLAEKALSFDRAMEITIDVESATKGARDITSRTCDNGGFMLLQTRHPQFMLFQTRHPQWLIMLTLLHPPTLNSFYLDTIFMTQKIQPFG